MLTTVPRLTAAAVRGAVAMTATASSVAAAASFRPLADPPPIITGHGHAPRGIGGGGHRALSDDPPIVIGKGKNP
jgi:hypothetical protein